jgi:2-polyprenyl-6-methoxyphenol hydroxylase-like FAD-dependent oxidoreductase
MTEHVLIVGAGPVGLYLGCKLRAAGLSCTIVERRETRMPHSRSIGVHPPALARLQTLGLAAPLVERGIPVRRGLAFSGGKQLGTLSFETLPGSFPFVLSVPQFHTESLLEAHFESMGEPVVRPASLVSFEQDPHGIRANLETADGARSITARWLIGCDGHRSGVREQLGIGWTGSAYADHFVMGDFPDATGFGPDAAIFMDGRGVVESFPLPGGIRRWVARMEQPVAESDVLSLLTAAVRERTGHVIFDAEALMTSAFTAEGRAPARVAVGRGGPGAPSGAPPAARKPTCGWAAPACPGSVVRWPGPCCLPCLPHGSPVNSPWMGSITESCRNATFGL